MIEIDALHDDGQVDLLDRSTQWRRAIKPGDDLSTLAASVRGEIESHWNEEVGGKTRAQRWFEAAAAADTEEPVNLVAYAAIKKWQTEVGGTTWNGWPVHTDRESQGKFTATMLAVNMGIRPDPDGWKFADGEFRSLSNEDFVQLAIAVFTHVSACFATEAAVKAAIAAEEITTTAEIDAAFAALVGT